MITWPQFLERVDANDGCASLALARSAGVPDGTWRTWRRRHGLVRIVNASWALSEPIGSRTILRAHLDALGERAMLGGRSALWALHGAEDEGPVRTPRPLEVCAERSLPHREDHGVHVRRSRTLRPEDLTTAHGWPCTSAARTAMDLVHRLEDVAALALLIDLVFHALVTPAQLVHRAQLTPTAWGAARMERLATPLLTERSDSIFEWWVRRCLTAVGLELHPGPWKVQTSDGVFEVDIAIPALRLAIECQGRTHLEQDQSDRDSRKVVALAAEGWLVIPVTWNVFHLAPSAFARRIAAIADARR